MGEVKNGDGDQDNDNSGKKLRFNGDVSVTKDDGSNSDSFKIRPSITMRL